MTLMPPCLLCNKTVAGEHETHCPNHPLRLDTQGVLGTGMLVVGIDPHDDYQALRVSRDGWAMLHPDLVAMLHRIERKLDWLHFARVLQDARQSPDHVAVPPFQTWPGDTPAIPKGTE